MRGIVACSLQCSEWLTTTWLALFHKPVVTKVMLSSKLEPIVGKWQPPVDREENLEFYNFIQERNAYSFKYFAFILKGTLKSFWPLVVLLSNCFEEDECMKTFKYAQKQTVGATHTSCGVVTSSQIWSNHTHAVLMKQLQCFFNLN